MLVIEDNIFSKGGSKLNDKVLAHFHTEVKTVNYESLCLSIVQNGYFSNYPYPSVGETFNNFFASPQWDYFYSTDNNHVVEFNGSAQKMDFLELSLFNLQ